MSASMCTQCISRLSLAVPVASRFAAPSSIAFTSFFHTSAANRALPVKAKTGPRVAPKFRVASSAKSKKKKKDRPKPPAPGERRTQRKRIVLSNTNALEVPGLEPLTKDNMNSEGHIGSMLSLNGELLDRLRDSKAFKTTQNWNLFRQPSTMMTGVTCSLGLDIAEINEKQEDQGFGSETIKWLVHGVGGSGKSIVLLQAMSMAFLNDWIVLHIPECQDYVLNNSSYAPAPGGVNTSIEQLYNQPHLAADILSRLAYANQPVLSKMKLGHTHDKSIASQKDKTVFDLASRGAEEPSLATAIFFAVWKELTVPTENSSLNQKLPPVLVTIDGLNQWMGPTRYRSSDFKPIHAHQFTLVRHFLSLLFNPEPRLFPNGGMVLAATTASNPPDHPSFDLLLDQLNARNLPMTDPRFPMPAPYAKVDQRILDLLKNGQHINVVELEGLSRSESKGLLEYYARSGILREQITDDFISSVVTMSGGGIVGHLCKYGSRIRA